jgi:hypothetical protein
VLEESAAALREGVAPATLQYTHFSIVSSNAVCTDDVHKAFGIRCGCCGGKNHTPLPADAPVPFKLANFVKHLGTQKHMRSAAACRTCTAAAPAAAAAAAAMPGAADAGGGAGGAGGGVGAHEPGQNCICAHLDTCALTRAQCSMPSHACTHTPMRAPTAVHMTQAMGVMVPQRGRSGRR